MESVYSNAVNRLNTLLGETEALYHELAQKLGLSDSAMRILYTLCDNGDPSPLQQVCRRSGLCKQTVNSALRKLEEQGMLYLTSAGPRTKQVCLTPRGRALARCTAGRVLEMENAVFAAWPERHVRDYLQFTERFLRDLREQAETLRPGGTGV